MAAQFGRRLRRGATTTAVAALAVAALTASQAPGAPLAQQTTDDGHSAADTTPSPDTPVSGNSPYYTDLPPLHTPNPPGNTVTNTPIGTGAAEAGLPATVLAAYKQAELTVQAEDPACRLPWQLLAAIGKVESGQARGGAVDANGTTLTPILGPVLNGVGFANISDTDNGQYDGDTTHDRAVGPMQFIPSTWATWGQDGNGDGAKDPNNIYDAALAAGKYLCAGGRDLTVQADLDKAILGYNQSQEYLRTVLDWFEYYKKGTHEVPDGSGVLPDTRTPDSLPTHPGPVPKPRPTPKPHPSKPAPKPTPDPPKPNPDPTRPTPKPTPTLRVHHIEDAGSGTLSATAGEEFGGRAKVRAENSRGAVVPGAHIRFEIIGATDARFNGGVRLATIITGASGTATAPVLKAGETTGKFTVRATVLGRDVRAVDVAAAVTARVADTLTRTDSDALTAKAGEKFANRATVRTTYKGVAVGDTAVTATMVASADATEANTKGPSFKVAGKTAYSLNLTTGADGTLQLPEMYADGETGTFFLRLTTASGAVLTIELKVEAAPTTTPSPSSSPSSSPSPSASASASPGA
ncbi:lytic transglycosylase domain-containing protein [Streptomyces sp. NPDC050504]|uniref:lytic transglycosylase domain-containing protein n=1 Tax=Streptomyces sp. NPDC050504 TaxID=3365618 RepID=UPI0037B40117